MTWIAPDVERSEEYPARRNEPEREMLRDWLEWHRGTLLRKCAGLDAVRLARPAPVNGRSRRPTWATRPPGQLAAIPATPPVTLVDKAEPAQRLWGFTE